MVKISNFEIFIEDSGSKATSPGLRNTSVRVHEEGIRIQLQRYLHLIASGLRTVLVFPQPYTPTIQSSESTCRAR